MRYGYILLVTLLLSLVAGCSRDDADETAATPAETPTPAATATPTAPAELAWEDVVELLEPSTVMIRADFPMTAVSYEGQGAGTGIVYSEDGYILTNSHVVSGAAALTVSTSGSPRQRSARFIGVSPCDDLAVIQVTDMEGFEVATLGDSSQERAGAEVAALGYPLGDILSLDMSFSRGVIGQMNESVFHFDRMIRHDATVNPGNSGGPLVNRKGEVIGVNTLQINPEFARNIAYAVDINQAKPIIAELEEGKNRLWLGMNLEPNFYADYFGTEDGLVVAAVASGSSASSTGVQPAFLLTHLQGLTVNAMEDVCRVLRSHQEGDSIKVEFMNITETEIQFLEGEVVLGGNGGSDLELVYSENFAGQQTSETEGSDDTAAGTDDDNGVETSGLSHGTWEGVAQVEIEYWAPCGEDDEWIHYHSETWPLDATVNLYSSYPGETNEFWLEAASDPTIDEVLFDEMPEGKFWMVSSWNYDEIGVLDYWILEHDDIEIFGHLYELRYFDYEIGNYVGSYLPVDGCTDEHGFEYAELEMDVDSYLFASLGEESGYLEIGGMTADLYRDFIITIELERVN